MRRSLLPLQLGDLLPRTHVRRLAAYPEPEVSGHSYQVRIHLPSERQQHLERPARFWEFAPFYTMNANNATEWNQRQINDFMLTLAADTAQKVSNDFTNSATNAIIAWMNDPYDPHMVASTRI